MSSSRQPIQDNQGPAYRPFAWLDFDVDQVSPLELFAPHAVTLLQRVWGTQAAPRAFRALVLDGQGRLREWPAAAWDDLLLLRELHQATYPDLPVGDRRDACDLELRYRHVLAPVVTAWGDPERFAMVLESLIVDRRGGRAGWPIKIWGDLMMLREVHDLAYA